MVYKETEEEWLKLLSNRDFITSVSGLTIFLKNCFNPQLPSDYKDILKHLNLSIYDLWKILYIFLDQSDNQLPDYIRERIEDVFGDIFQN